MKYPTRYRWTNRIVRVQRVLPLDADDERRAAIQAARLFARVVVLRPLFAVADGVQPIGADAAADVR